MLAYSIASALEPGCKTKSSESTLLDGTNVRLNWNIESDLNVYWIKFKNLLSLY